MMSVNRVRARANPRSSSSVLLVSAPSLGAWNLELGSLPKLQHIVLCRVQRLPSAEGCRNVAADDMEAVADDAARHSVARQRHVSERLPAVARRVVGLERARHGIVQG